jgi:hypothetical protein
MAREFDYPAAVSWLRVDGASVSLTHVRRARLLGWIAMVAWLLPLFIFNIVRMVNPASSPPPWAVVSVLMAFAAFLRGLHDARFPTRLAPSYQVLPDALRVGTRHFARHDIISGAVVRVGGKFMTELSLRNGSLLAIEDSTEDRAEALLHELGLAADQRRATLAAGEPRIASLWMALTALVLSFVAMTWTHSLTPLVKNLHLVGIASIAIAVSVLLSTVEVTVGRDGVLIRQPLRRRFIPYQNIEAVGQNARGEVELLLNDGSRVAMGSALTLSARGDALERARALRRRIEQARAAPRDGPRPGDHLLERQGRSLEAWRRRLHRLLSTDVDYRGPKLQREQVLGVLADPNTTAEVRIGAALALADGGLDPETRRRLRIAADTSANAKVRVALQRICEFDDETEAIEEAVALEERARRHGSREQ